MKALGPKLMAAAIAALLLSAVPVLSAVQAWADELFPADVAWYHNDYPEAIRIYQAAAARGNRMAQRRLGDIYSTTTAFWTPDYAEAAKWYRMAAERGDPASQDGLALLYRDGQGVAQDYAEALKWLRRAAAKDSYVAQYHLGQMYRAGFGVPQDNVHAFMWLSLSAGNDAGEILEARDDLARSMTAQQMAEAQKLAQACQLHNFKNCE